MWLFLRFFNIISVTGPLSEVQIAYICRETLLGLCYLHNHGRMHRDIKVIEMKEDLIKNPFIPCFLSLCIYDYFLEIVLAIKLNAF